MNNTAKESEKDWQKHSIKGTMVEETIGFC